MEIQYIVGDATRPIGDGNKIICHVCNDIGAWGRGFVLALSKRSRKPEHYYRKWFNEGTGFVLGNVQFVKLNSEETVANMIAQSGLYSQYNTRPIHYEALFLCLNKVCDKAKATNATIHMPRIGAGLARGDWEIIESIIKSTLIEQGIQVIVYDLPK